MVKFRENCIGARQRLDALGIRLELRAGNCEDRHRIFQHIEVRASAAAAQTESCTPRVHHLRHDGARRPPHRRSHRRLHLLGRLREDQRLAGMDEQQNHIRRQRRPRQRRIHNILWLALQHGNLRQVFRPHVTQLPQHFERIHQIGLLRGRRLQAMCVDSDRAVVVIARRRCKGGCGSIFPEAASSRHAATMRGYPGRQRVGKRESHRRLLQIERRSQSGGNRRKVRMLCHGTPHVGSKLLAFGVCLR